MLKKEKNVFSEHVQPNEINNVLIKQKLIISKLNLNCEEIILKVLNEQFWNYFK